MTLIELERWKQLSLGLARGYKNLTARRQKKLLDEVENCIDWVVCNGLDTVEDWDRSIYKDGRLMHECAGSRVEDYLWDNRYEFEREYRNGNIEVVLGRFGAMLSTCIRAGFDMAVSPSAGVIGFSVGDLRDAFDGEIPGWIAERFDDPAALLAADRNESVWL